MKKFPKEKYNLREAKGKDYYKIMIVNEALKNYAYKNDFPFLLHFEIDLKETIPPFNLPTEKEAQILNKTEDQIQLILKSCVKSHFIGRTTNNGYRELFFYIQEPEKLHEKLQEAIDLKIFTRELSYSIDFDEEWDRVKFFYNY